MTDQRAQPDWPRPDYVERANRRAVLHTEGIRGMFILNGGGVLALLTFLTQMIQDSATPQFVVRYIIAAIGMLLIGLLLLTPINHLRYESSRLHDNEKTKSKGKKFSRAHRILFSVSIVLFAAGVGTALIGVWIWKG